MAEYCPHCHELSAAIVAAEGERIAAQAEVDRLTEALRLADADAERLAEALEIPCKRRRAGGARPEVQIRDGEAGRMDRALALHAARLAADAAPGGDAGQGKQ
jgi:hypothetical protein